VSRVIFMCGPSGAGKTTYAAGLESQGMVRLSFDSHLWDRGIRSGEVDPAVREEVRELLRAELVELVTAGRDVVLDFSFWSRAMREEWRDLVSPRGVEPETVHLATDPQTVLDRLEARTGSDADDFPVDRGTAMSYLERFEPPAPEEGPLRLVVDGEEFSVTTRGHGQYGYSWTSGPNRGYGFTSFTTDRSPIPAARHARAVRDFLAMIDPATGYIEEDG
jgi:predicted kinase